MATLDKAPPLDASEKPAPASSIQTLLEGFHKAAIRIPQAEKDNLPEDLFENLDHYVC